MIAAARLMIAVLYQIMTRWRTACHHQHRELMLALQPHMMVRRTITYLCCIVVTVQWNQ